MIGSFSEEFALQEAHLEVERRRQRARISRVRWLARHIATCGDEKDCRR